MKGVETSRSPEPSRSLITVVGENDEARPAEDLAQAVKMAMGAKGWIELHNREPLVVSGLSAAVNSATRGSLKIRAAQGVKPVLNVEIKGQQPLLIIGSGTNLVMEGVEIAAHYVDQPQAGTAVPVIRTAGATQLRNCRFSLKGSAMVPGSRAIIMEGSNLAVDNCSFRGWDVAVAVFASGGSIAELHNTMILPGRDDDSLPSSPGSSKNSTVGWGIRMEFFPSLRSSHRQLVLKQCTVVGQGLLQLVGFSLDTQLRAEITGCAVQSKTLIGWKPGPSEKTWDSRMLIWRGEDNHFEITGPSWVTNLAEPGSSASETIDRKKWLALMIERNLVSSPIQFADTPEAHPGTNDLEAFEVKTTGKSTVGAIPSLIGAQGFQSKD